MLLHKKMYRNVWADVCTGASMGALFKTHYYLFITREHKYSPDHILNVEITIARYASESRIWPRVREKSTSARIQS